MLHVASLEEKILLKGRAIRLKIFAATHKGSVRKQNQDCYAFRVINDGLAFGVVCDGMGGERAGDVASKLACETITERLESSIDASIRPSAVKNIIESAVSVANIKVYEMALKESKYSGMGTTVVVVVVLDDVLYICNAGDSRVYSVKDGKAQQLTTDHTVVQSLLDAGEITPEQAKKHPQKHYITRALGVQKDLDLDYNEYEFGDNAVVACSDGFSNYADNDVVAKLVKDSAQASSAENIVAYALEHGGSDNITAVVLVGGNFNG